MRAVPTVIDELTGLAGLFAGRKLTPEARELIARLIVIQKGWLEFAEHGDTAGCELAERALRAGAVVLFHLSEAQRNEQEFTT